MEIKGTNVNLNQKIKEDSQVGKKLAKEIMLFADKNSSAVSKSEFQEKLNKMEKLSTQDLIKFIRSFDKDESIIELICDEIGDDKKVRKEACKKVLNALVNKAKELGIETSDFEKQFTEELGSQFSFLGKYINTDKLDSIINALTQSIENRLNLTSEDLQTIQNTSAEEGANQSNDVLENRLEKAYASFGERVGENGEMTTKDKNGNLYNGQMQRDGIAADIADGVSRIWGSENTATKVRKDLKATNEQLRQLQEAKLQGEEAYNAKFKEIFGVEYDYANILAYQKAEVTYINASANHEFEMAFNRNLKTLLSPAPLREEVRYDNPDPMTNMVITTVTATKEQVYNREFNNLANFIGENGTEILNAALAEKGVANGNIEEKFEVLKQITKALSKQLHTSTLEAGGGKEFSEVQAMYDNSYKAAYGVENDIMKRVTDYNVSQEKGAGVVKAGVTIAASLAAAFSGIGLVGVAAITAGTTVATEVVDRGTSGKALNALREDGVGAYIKTANDDIDWEATLKQAVISGGAVLIGGAVAKGVSIVMEGAKPAAQAIAQFGGDIVCDAGMEYLTTGKITVEGMVFAVLLSAAGNIVAMKQLSAAADAAKSADEAIDGTITNVAQPEIDVKTKLSNAGFTDDVIQNLKAQSDFYGPELVDEVLDMIVYLEDQVAAGKPITKELIESAIDLYSPGASGGSAYTQRAMIANTWNRGDEVFNAYGQKAPGQGTFSTGNMKAKYNKIKNGINDYIDYKKWEWGLDNPTAKTTAVDTSSPNTDFASKLADIKGPDGKPFLTKSEIDNLLENCQHGFVTDGKPIPDFEARIMAVLSNPEEIASLADWKSRAAGVWRAIQDPLQSTVDLNPTAFGVKPKVTDIPTMPTIDDIATVLDDLPVTSGTSEAQLSQIRKAARVSNYDHKVVLDMMQKYPDVVDKLTTFKAPDGSQFFSAQDISDILFNCKQTIEANPERMFAILNNPKEIADIAGWKSRGAGVWRAIGDPLQSTIDANPTVFGAKPKATATVETTNFATKLADIKGPDGKPFLTKTEIDNLLENCQHGFVTDGKPIPDFEARIMAVLSNPEEIASLADWKSRAAGVWRAIQDPLQSTVDLNPSAFGVKPKVTAATGATDFATKLADVKGPDGKPFLTKSEIDNLLENCQHGFVTDGKPIPDFEARIMAVLSNPEEIASLADWKSRSAGVWRAIQDPLQSTVDLNPAAFGVKPKATTVTKQTAPSQKLPDVVDKIYGGKAEAEAVVFGNGTLADINPSIVENATEELTKYFGREIKASDLQVVRNSNGAYISYFDPETGLATTFSNSGKLNGQFKITFDAQGNIQSFDLETIYADGKFWLR